jgi:hypothetical protein
MRNPRGRRSGHHEAVVALRAPLKGERYGSFEFPQNLLATPAPHASERILGYPPRNILAKCSADACAINKTAKAHLTTTNKDANRINKYSLDVFEVW